MKLKSSFWSSSWPNASFYILGVLFFSSRIKNKHLKSLMGFSRLLWDWYRATSQWLFEIIIRIVKFPNKILLEIDLCLNWPNLSEIGQIMLICVVIHPAKKSFNWKQRLKIISVNKHSLQTIKNILLNIYSFWICFSFFLKRMVEKSILHTYILYWHSPRGLSKTIFYGEKR